MFSAIYLVCFVGQPCMSFVDKPTYPSYEQCVEAAEATIVRNSNNISQQGLAVPEVDYQCISWSKA